MSLTDKNESTEIQWKLQKILKPLVKQNDYSKKFENGVFNISSGKPVTLKNHVLGITKKNKLKIKLKFGKVPYLKYEPKIFWGLNKY